MTPRRRLAPPIAALVALAWQSPLASIPFGGFFLLLGGRPLSAFPGYYIAALAFASGIGLANWAVRFFVVPHIAPEGDERRGLFASIGAHTVASLIASWAVGIALDRTIAPGFFGGPRGAVVFTGFTILFTALFLGAYIAWHLWQRALERAKSEQELVLARRIQRSFLISEFPPLGDWQVHAVNRSSREVSGDFYDVVAAGDGALLVAIADVSGKGVPAALLSSMLQASLRTQAGTVHSVGAMTATMNTMVCQRPTTGQFATFFLARLDERTRTITWTNAGHNFPIVFHADGTRTTLEDGGLVLGMLDGLPYAEGRLTLRPGDRLLLYTDGVTEAEREDGEMFGDDRLVALGASLPRALDAEGTVQAVLAGVDAFLAGREPGDDITVLVVHVPDGPSH